MIGEDFGHYCMLEKIGAGGIGVVYRAHDERLDRDVAVNLAQAGYAAAGSVFEVKHSRAF